MRTRNTTENYPAIEAIAIISIRYRENP